MHEIIPNLSSSLSAEKRARFDALWEQEKETYRRGTTFRPPELEDFPTFREYRHYTRGPIVQDREEKRHDDYRAAQASRKAARQAAA